MRFSEGSVIKDFEVSSGVIKRTVFREDYSLEYVGFFKSGVPFGVHYRYNCNNECFSTINYGDGGKLIEISF